MTANPNSVYSMPKYTSIFFFLTVLFLSGCQTKSTSPTDYDAVLLPESGIGLWGDIDLSPEEEQWLNTHHTVRVHVGNLPPYMIPGDEPQGMAIDYVSLILQRHGLEPIYFSPPEVTRVDAWEQVTNKNGIDLMPTMSNIPERECCFVFSRGYLNLPWVIVTRDDGDFVGSIEDLYGKTIILPSNLGIADIITENYPQINVKTVEGVDVFEQVVTALATGQADATIADLAVITYRIQNYGATNLKIAAEAPFARPENGMGIRNDWPELASIITKSLDAMTPAQHIAIRNRWLSVRYEYGLRTMDIVKWVLIVFALASMIVAFILRWNRRLEKEVKQRKQAEANMRKYSLQLEQTIEARTATLKNLEEALAKVKQLSGLLPICASCKKVRDDDGYWQQVEVYISRHSEAEFTHGMCPECIEKWYPNLKTSKPDKS